MPDLRQLREDEFELSLELSGFAFQYTPSPEDRERARRSFQPDHVWGVFEEGQLAAKLTIHPFEAFVSGHAMPMGGIAGVATWPNHRRGGHAATLLRHALATMRQAGQPVSFLYPFSVAFYRRYGWELVSHKLRYTLARADLPGPVKGGGGWSRLTPDGWARLNEVYRAYARGYEGMLDRREARWREYVLTARRQVLVHWSDAGDDAYLVYEVSNREFRVIEAAWLGEGARRALWTFVAQHDSMVDTVTWEAPSDDRLPFLLDNPTFRQEVRPSFMARVVDLEAFLVQYRFRQGRPFEVVLAVSDSDASWNAGTWLLRVDSEGRATIERSDRGQELACGIGTLSALLFGYLTPSEALAFGQVSGEASAALALENAIGRRTAHLFDFF